MTLTVLTLTVLTGVLVGVGQVWNRRALARFADLQYTLAVLARLQGQPDLAAAREARAAANARAAWPFKVKPRDTYETPVGLVTFNGTMSEEEVAAFTARWREAMDVSGGYRIIPVRRPHRRWWWRW